MSDIYYKEGFIKECESLGITKSASEELYKSAQWRAAGRGVLDIGKGLYSAGKGIGTGILGVGTALGSTLEASYNTAGAVAKALRLDQTANALSKVLSSKIVRKIPYLNSFARGFVRANRIANAPGYKRGILSYLTDPFHLWGKGTTIGNTLHGLGQIAAEHPIVGALTIASPAALLTAKHHEDNEDFGSIDVLDPIDRKIFNRRYSTSGYAGLDSDTRNRGIDISSLYL